MTKNNDVQDITVQDALRRVLDCFALGKFEKVSLTESLGRVLAEPVAASTSLPPFANSSMDGYALRAEDLIGTNEKAPQSLKVIGDISAGNPVEVEVIEGTAVRIMTGAPMPFGADAVVPVEMTDEAWAERERPLPDVVLVFKSVKSGDYVRPAGGDVFKGQVVLEAGTTLRPFEIAMLAAMGVNKVDVVKRPIIGILATGDELLSLIHI